MPTVQQQQTRNILAKVRQVEIRTKKIVTDAMAGAYHSVFKGQGMDFEEVREYAVGDEVRSIDWNVTARMGTPFIKKFREERELTVMLMVDLSASGSFGSTHQTKRELAAELASVLAFSAIRNNDKVGVILFTDKVEKIIPPKKGRQHVLRVIRDILFFKPEEEGTHLVKALDTLNHILKRKAAVFLFSDFLQDQTGKLINLDAPEQQMLKRALNITHKRHDLVCVPLSDPREMELPAVGTVVLEDAETGQQIEIDTQDSALCQEYSRENEKRQGRLLHSFRHMGVDVLPLSTDQPYLPVIKHFFEIRMKRR